VFEEVLMKSAGAENGLRGQTECAPWNDIASYDTFSRVFSPLDPKQSAACAGRWMAAVKAGIEANRCPVRFLP
jgi:hypothetical protein